MALSVRAADGPADAEEQEAAGL